MRGSRIFAMGGGGGTCPTARKQPLTTIFFLIIYFSPKLILQFYRGCPMVISMKTIIFQGFKAGPIFSRLRVHLFPGESKC